MKCMSCQSDINPKWKHAIDTNLCPCCGNTIMEEEVKKLLAALSDSMEGLSKHPEYLNDWLLSRFNFVPATQVQDLEKQVEELKKKAFSATAVKIKEQAQARAEEPVVDSESTTVAVQDEQVTSEFFKRSEADKVVKNTKNLKDLVSQIKSTGVQAGTTSDLMVHEDAEPEIMSSLDSTDDEQIPPSVLAFANAAKMPGGAAGYNPRDLAKLQELQERSGGARQRMLAGGNKGGFSR